MATEVEYELFGFGVALSEQASNSADYHRSIPAEEGWPWRSNTAGNVGLGIRQHFLSLSAHADKLANSSVGRLQ